MKRNQGQSLGESSLYSMHGGTGVTTEKLRTVREAGHGNLASVREKRVGMEIKAQSEFQKETQIAPRGGQNEVRSGRKILPEFSQKVFSDFSKRQELQAAR